ncbi:kinase-like domain-containing protein [Roridomyces roridus]|uniref:Kinase-like domain-containing protein n=1 Tax=Roridomyces roridus TaxID=1738132 RepID=A0AAD7BM85_9AGAR|nr:kinase-like domain-containing protein [Roridomyces roridus]
MHSASYNLPDLTGEFVDGRSIELLCLLGSGAYGKVYKAYDHHEGQLYAVKCMPKYEPGSRGARMQESELLVHRMLSGHPRVISLIREFSTDSLVFAVLELATGGDLFTALVERQCYRGKPELIKAALGELLDAVEYIHRNQVFHRDLKPENILCSPVGTDIQLADFGLATQVAISHQFGCGSRFYMSPESIDAGFATGCYSARSSDLWALSVIFTNMICGLHPWNSAAPADPGYAAFQNNPEYLYKALRISRPAFLLLKRCFHLNPLKRPTLDEFREAVNAMECFSQEDEESLAPAPAPPSRIFKPLPCLPVQDFPRAVSPNFEWAHSTTNDIDCDKTPRPAVVPQFPTDLMALRLQFSSASFLDFSSPTPSHPPSSSSSQLPPSCLEGSGSSPPTSDDSDSLPSVGSEEEEDELSCPVIVVSTPPPSDGVEFESGSEAMPLVVPLPVRPRRAYIPGRPKHALGAGGSRVVGCGGSK